MRKKNVVSVESVPKSAPLVLTVAQVAEYLQVPVGSIYEWTRYRATNRAVPAIPFRRVGKYLRFIKSEVDSWLLALPTGTARKKQQYRRAA